jgi:hypothetical protein
LIELDEFVLVYIAILGSGCRSIVDNILFNLTQPLSYGSLLELHTHSVTRLNEPLNMVGGKTIGW